MKQTILLFAALLCISGNRAQACTNLLITKGASADGSCMVTYAADSHTRYGCLAFYPAAFYPKGTMM
ncbi:MAG: C69 family dipeptidase, partial [Bacteroidales bacterium]|nr:C69 family dipeptidase [Bacteroidales bacterium]